MANQIATLRMEQKFKKTPAGTIPIDWEYQRISDLAQLINGHGFGPSDWKPSGTPIIRIQNLNGSPDYNYYQGPVEDNWLVNSGDLLFSWSGSIGTSFGPYIWKGPKAVLNQHIFVVKNHEEVDRAYLYQILRAVTVAIEQRAHGSAGLVHVTKRELEGFVVPLPPTGEQRKIAEILSAVDDVIEKARNEIEATRRLERQMARMLLSQGIGKWDIFPLRDFLREPIRNGYSPLCPFKPTGQWTLELGALSEDGFRPNRAKPAPADDPKVAEALLQHGDLLVSRSNTRELVGLASIYEGAPENCIYPDLMMRVRVSQGKMDPRFLEIYLVSPHGRRYFETQARGTSGSMVKINGAILGEMPIPRPPINEQRRIVERLGRFRRLVNSNEEAQKSLIQLRRSLMSELLTGRTRVTQ